MYLKLIKKPLFLSLLITIAIPNYLLTLEIDKLQILLNYKHLLFQINLFFLLTILFVFFKLFLIRDKLDIFFNFIIFWVFISGILIPVAGRFDPFLNTGFFFSNVVQLFLQFIIVIFILYTSVKKNKVKNLINRFMIVYTVLLIIFTSYVLINNKRINPNELNKITNFDKKNFLVLGFDGIAHNFKDFILTNEELKKELKDFIIYENYFISHPRTRYSLSAEFYDLTEISNEKQLQKKINTNKVSNFLKENTSLQTYGNYNTFNGNDERYFRGDILNNKNIYYSNYFFNQLFVPSLSRWLTPKIYNFFNSFKYTQSYKRFLTILNLKILNGFDENLETDYRASFYDYNNFVKTIKFKDTGKDETLVKFMHFEFTHWPIIFDEKCKNKSNDINWNKLNLVEQNNRLNECIGTLINKIIMKLKKEKVYDNSYIIIKGDHGKPNGYYTLNSKESTKLRESIYWGFGRYKTFAMLKKPNQHNENLEIISKNVLAGIDIRNLYCEKVLECKKKNYTHLFLPNTKDSFMKLDDYKKYKIINNDNVFDLMNIHNEN